MRHWILELLGAPHFGQRYGAIDVISPGRNGIIRRHNSLPTISFTPL